MAFCLSKTRNIVQCEVELSRLYLVRCGIGITYMLGGLLLSFGTGEIYKKIAVTDWFY